MKTIASKAQGRSAPTAQSREPGTAEGESLKDQLTQSMQPVSHALTLPPRVYTSPNVYELEKATIFSREWIMVGRAEQIPNGIDQVEGLGTFSVVGNLGIGEWSGPFMAFRNASGQFVADSAAAALCRPRG